MNSLDIKVAPAQDNHYPKWIPLWSAYQDFYKVCLSEQTTKTTWKRFFDDSEPIFIAVAIKGEELLGFVHYVIHRSTWAEENFCYLEDLYVSPGNRGQRIGKRLIEFVKQQAISTNCARLYWHTQENNHTAQKLYNWVAEKIGVIEYRVYLK